jgi:hypothetical protein
MQIYKNPEAFQTEEPQTMKPHFAMNVQLFSKTKAESFFSFVCDSLLSAVLADFKVFPPSNCLTIITSIVCYILAGTYILYISEDQRSVKRRHQELRFILNPKSLKLKSENLK